MTEKQMFKEVFVAIKGNCANKLTMTGNLVYMDGDCKFNTAGYNLLYNIKRLTDMVRGYTMAYDLSTNFDLFLEVMNYFESKYHHNIHMCGDMFYCDTIAPVNIDPMSFDEALAVMCNALKAELI